MFNWFRRNRETVQVKYRRVDGRVFFQCMQCKTKFPRWEYYFIPDSGIEFDLPKKLYSPTLINNLFAEITRISPTHHKCLDGLIGVSQVIGVDITRIGKPEEYQPSNLFKLM